MGMMHCRRMTLGALLCGGIASQAYALDIQMMGDIRYGTSTVEDSHNGFALGQFDTFAAQQIDPATHAFVEFVIEGEDSFIIDLERLFVSRKFSKAFELGAGRYHSPLGYWNRVFHHGALMQDTVSRPMFLEFEDEETGVLPMHIVGLSASGSWGPSASEFAYELAVGNSSSLNSNAGFFPAEDDRPEIAVHNGGDKSDTKAVVARVSYQPPSVPMHVALFGMKNHYVESGDVANGALLAEGDELVSQTVWGLDARYAVQRLEALTEFFFITNDNKVGATGSYDATAFYVQLGYGFTPQIKGIYRFETLDFEADDAYFQLLNTQEQDRHVFDVRWNLDESNALKFEIANIRPQSRGSDTSFTVQWAFLMF